MKNWHLIEQQPLLIKFEKGKAMFENLAIEAIETSIKSIKVIKLPPRMYF